MTRPPNKAVVHLGKDLVKRCRLTVSLRGLGVFVPLPGENFVGFPLLYSIGGPSGALAKRFNIRARMPTISAKKDRIGVLFPFGTGLGERRTTEPFGHLSTGARRS